MVPPISDRISRVPPYSRTIIELTHTGLSPATARLSRRFCLSNYCHWPGPRSLAATDGVSVDVLSCGYLDVSVPRVRFLHLWIQCKIPSQRYLETIAVFAHAPYRPASIRSDTGAAGAARARRTSGDGRSALRSLAASTPFPMMRFKETEFGAKHRKRDCASGPLARPVRRLVQPVSVRIPAGRSTVRTKQ